MQIVLANVHSSIEETQIIDTVISLKYEQKSGIPARDVADHFYPIQLSETPRTEESVINIKIRIYNVILGKSIKVKYMGAPISAGSFICGMGLCTLSSEARGICLHKAV